jgi:hypothetical protein
VELQNFLNDVVTDSPELGNVRFRANPSGQPTEKRNLVDPLVEASKIWKRNGGGRGRGRGRGGNNGGDRGQPSTNPDRVDFKTLVDAMTLEERKKHMDEGLCFKCHKRGHRLFQCPEWKGKAPMVARLFY